MDREMINKIRRHQGKSVTEKIGEDDFEFKPLAWGDIDRLLILASSFEEGKQMKFTPEITQMLKELLFDFVRNSFDAEIEDEDIRMFCSANMIKLVEIMFEMHNFGTEESKVIRTRLQQIGETRKKMEDIRAQDSGASSEKKED